MSEPRYACGRCGTWTCSACGRQRPNTDTRYVDYPCGRCRGLAGVLVPTMHTAKMWAKHNDGLLPKAYPYGARPSAEEWGPGFGSRDVPQPHYRGVPVPSDSRLDMESFRRGVDAALEAVRPTVTAQCCGHAVGEHSVYGCLDSCACEKRPDLRTGTDNPGGVDR